MRLLLPCILLILSITAFANSELIYEAKKKNIDLTEKDKTTLEIGEISTTRYIIGGVLGTYPIGLGIGHAVQGRWSEQGQIFTWGELGSLGLVVAGAVGCVDESADGDDDWTCSSLESALVLTGVIGFVGFRIWEIVDVWATPPSQNKKFHSLKKYIDGAKAAPQVKSSLDLVPVIAPRMGQGLGLKFTF